MGMKLSELLNYWIDTYNECKQRDKKDQIMDYIQNINVIPRWQANAEHAVQENAPINLSLANKLFREKINYWQQEMLKTKKMLSHWDVYYAHFLASVDVKYNQNYTHHCSGFLLYMSGVITYNTFRSAGVPECFANRVLSAGAHTFNNIEHSNALQSRNTIFGAFAISGILMLSCQPRNLKLLLNFINRFANKFRQNPIVNHAVSLRGNYFSLPNILGSTLLASSTLLSFEDIKASRDFKKAPQAKLLFEKNYIKKPPNGGDSSPQNNNDNEIINLLISMP